MSFSLVCFLNEKWLEKITGLVFAPTAALFYHEYFYTFVLPFET
jgi:hypothetical protein